MGMFFESIIRILRDWWQALVRPFKAPPPIPEITDAELESRRVVEAATQHEEEVAAEAEVDNPGIRTRPQPFVIVHGWTEGEFDTWWESLTDKQKNFHHMEPVAFPEGVSLHGDDWRYWNTRALDRSRRYNYRKVTTPKGNGMGEDGGQS